MRANNVLKQLSTAAHHAYSRPHTLTRPSPFIRPLNPNGAGPSQPASLESDFQLYPAFFNEGECRQLLGMALWKLDRADSTRRRRRKGASGGSGEAGQEVEGLQGLFEGEYGFEEGHYDSVIHHYRETLLSNFPPPDKAWPDLHGLMKRIYDLLPSPSSGSSSTSPTPGTAADIPPRSTLTHLLHLAPHGAILPHVDNLEASGSVIIGTSLGAERVLRLKDKEGDSGWDVRLPSGSLYLQRDAVRYRYEHSILPYDDPGSVWDGKRLDRGHRVSLMVRLGMHNSDIVIALRPRPALRADNTLIVTSSVVSMADLISLFSPDGMHGHIHSSQYRGSYRGEPPPTLHHPPHAGSTVSAGNMVMVNIKMSPSPPSSASSSPSPASSSTLHSTLRPFPVAPSTAPSPGPYDKTADIGFPSGRWRGDQVKSDFLPAFISHSATVSRSSAARLTVVSLESLEQILRTRGFSSVDAAVADKMEMVFVGADVWVWAASF